MKNIARKWFIRLATEEKGVGTLEFLMILTVLVSIALVFRQWIFSWIGDALTHVSPVSSPGTPGLPTPH